MFQIFNLLSNNYLEYTVKCKASIADRDPNFLSHHNKKTVKERPDGTTNISECQQFYQRTNTTRMTLHF
jgi:hypothetical protein